MNIVLLQGPLGPFFADLADALAQQGMVVHRICFNKGDWHYAKADHVVNYTEGADTWPEWFTAYAAKHDVQAVVCYGDSRHYHRLARGVCDAENIKFFACEEGYVRPGFVTFEEAGNNANSLFPAKFRAGTLSGQKKPSPAKIQQIFKHQFWFATIYYIVKDWKLHGFRHYKHHRSGNWASEMMAWLRAGFRKQFITRFAEKGLTDRLVQRHAGNLFVVPLQVAVDTQMIYHSRFDSVEDFITEVMRSFAAHAPADAHLVIKHHPMDRGFNHYGRVITKLSTALNCESRVTYAFDVDLGVLLENAAGCVTVNSTVASQALEAGVPTVTLGKSMLQAAGLTAVCALDVFWRKVPSVNVLQIQQFKNALITHTQTTGSFYCDRDIAAHEIAIKIVKILRKK
ncbi:capsular biosynthesis protein [Kordiimonas aquimaris]|uniref:capsular biosynthesis protein n=1 Tax=Kordiimonas aquimaris TaxID=707591 RepID=UPI0021D10A73|nr:capsular biosynthesis protein [Kordiimonas aquimaris]